jgi:hypothetical protein
MSNNMMVFNKMVFALMIMIVILIVIAVGTIINEGGVRFLNVLKNNSGNGVNGGGGFSTTKIILWGAVLVAFFIMIYVMLHTKNTVYVRPSAGRERDN